MKKIFRIFALVAVAAAALTACQKEGANAVEEGINIKVVADGAGSKTALVDDGASDPYIKWLQSDAITLWETAGSSVKNSDSNKTTLSGTDDQQAEFDITLSGQDPGAETYVYTAVSPAGAVTAGSSFHRFMMPAEQSIAADGAYDSAADILLGKPLTRTSRATEGETLSFQFARPGTVAKFTIKGLTAGEVVNSVTITAPVNIAGYSKFDLATGEVSDKAYSNASKSIKLTAPVATAPAQYVTTGVDAFCFRLLDGVWSAGETLSVTVDTDKAVYTKSVTLPKTLEFADGGYTTFTMKDLTRTEKGTGDKYYIVTDATQLSAGDQIIIAAAATNYAVSVTQNNNNRAAVEITKSGEGDEAYIESPGEDVQIIELAEGSTSGSFAFVVGDGAYLNAPGGGNYLRTTDAIAASSSWTVEISATYVATITSQGTATQKYIRKNSGSALFSCYGSGQADVCIYRLDDGKTSQTLSFAESSYEASIGTAFTVPEVSGAQTSPLKWTSSNPAAASITEDGEVTLVGTGNTIITVTAPASEVYRSGSASFTLNVSGPVIEPIADPETASVSGETIVVDYSVSNPVPGGSISAETTAEWISSITVDSPSAGKISIVVDANSDNARSATVTVSYPYAQDVEFTVSQASGSGSQDFTAIFSTKSWGISEGQINWTSGKDGNQFQSGRGVQITSGASGAAATTNGSFTGVSKVVITYSTNASNGEGSIAVKVGDTDAVSQNVTKTGGTTDRTLEFDVTGDGALNFEVTCSKNSIYVKDITVTASGYSEE
ncbi:MAG: hypothetical protein IJU69_02040 [Bacteroidales bacterium]|nr:hypothetical protein [Bacteroidales bacterium]